LYVKFENEYERIERENYEKYEIEWERSRNEQDEFNPVIKINEVKLQALQDFQTANEILISQINHHFINIFPKEEKRVYDDDDDNSLINPIDHPLYNDDLDMDQQNPNIW
jgi:predicted nucleic acid-binding protein